MSRDVQNPTTNAIYHMPNEASAFKLFSDMCFPYESEYASRNHSSVMRNVSVQFYDYSLRENLFMNCALIGG